MAFNGRFIINIAHFARKQGASSKELIAATGLTEEELMAEDCTVDDRIYNAVIEKCVQDTSDLFFGLHAGENMNLSAAGLIMQLVQTCSTVKQALELSCEFANLGCSAMPLSLKEKTEHYKLTLTPNPVWAEQSFTAMKHTAVGTIGFTIRQYHSLTQMKFYPAKIHFTWKKETNFSEYERVYGCPVHFNQKENAIFLPKKMVEAKILTADYQLQKILFEFAQDKSNRLKNEKGFAAIVKESVVLLMRPEFPGIDRVASHLNMSARSLQRKLNEEGLRFKNLTEELKKEFAISYLKRESLSISEVAYLLSYSDISSFTRAFKKWTGMSPTQFRTE